MTDAFFGESCNMHLRETGGFFVILVASGIFQKYKNEWSYFPCNLQEDLCLLLGLKT